MMFFIDNNIASTGTYMGVVDSAIIEGIERGFALALNRPPIEAGM